MKNTFDALSSSYDAVLTRDLWISGEKAAYFARYKAERVQKTLGNHFKGRVLDYGCGIGAVAKSLRSFSPGRSEECEYVQADAIGKSFAGFAKRWGEPAGKVGLGVGVEPRMAGVAGGVDGVHPLVKRIRPGLSLIFRQRIRAFDEVIEEGVAHAEDAVVIGQM